MCVYPDKVEGRVQEKRNARVAFYVAVVTDLGRVSCYYVGCVCPVALCRVCVPCVFP